MKKTFMKIRSVFYKPERTSCPYNMGIKISKLEGEKIYCSIEQNQKPFIECNRCDYNLALEGRV